MIRVSYLTVMSSVLSLVALSAGVSFSAHALDCPPAQNACGSAVCCAVHDICCTDGRGACCPVATPYCCGDGTCAVTPTACGNESESLCPEYQISCGGVCIEAGSDCCDEAGDYCLPTQTCTLDACSVAGVSRPRLHKNDPHAAPGGFLMPTADPLGPQRSCSALAPAARAGKAAKPTYWLCVCLLLMWMSMAAAAARRYARAAARRHNLVITNKKGL